MSEETGGMPDTGEVLENNRVTEDIYPIAEEVDSIPESVYGEVALVTEAVSLPGVDTVTGEKL